MAGRSGAGFVVLAMAGRAGADTGAGADHVVAAAAVAAVCSQSERRVESPALPRAMGSPMRTPT